MADLSRSEALRRMPDRATPGERVSNRVSVEGSRPPRSFPSRATLSRFRLRSPEGNAPSEGALCAPSKAGVELQQPLQLAATGAAVSRQKQRQMADSATVGGVGRRDRWIESRRSPRTLRPSPGDDLAVGASAAVKAAGYGFPVMIFRTKKYIRQINTGTLDTKIQAKNILPFR